MSVLLPLSSLLSDGRPNSFAVARSDGVIWCWGDLCKRVASLMGAIEEHAGGEPGQRWLLYSDDSFTLAVGLLALWQRRAVAVIPPNGQPGTLRGHSEGTVGLIGGGAIEGFEGVHIDSAALSSCVPISFERLDPSELAIELFTSGTSGMPKSVPKRLAHLESEILFLEKQWGGTLGEAVVFSTVSHHHLYGLLFRLLWPLCAGRVFRLERLLLGEEVVPRMEAEGDAILVSSPTHLARMGALARLRSCCCAIYSSGGPLEAATAERVATEVGVIPIEVYGSTETGGIAWREQCAGVTSSPWSPFDSVRIEIGRDAELRVASPHVSLSEQGLFFSTGDGAEMLADGRFRLLGRVDRVVKLGEKRLSLPAMEERLREHPLVEDVRLLIVRQGNVERIGCVARLSVEGHSVLASEGRRSLSTQLRTYLEPFWDRILLPRAWRYVDQFSEDSQGKVSLASLERLFEEEALVRITKPEVLAEHWGADACTIEFRVPGDLLYLKGHFPEFPVVAGIVQLEWVVDAATRLLGDAPCIERMEGLKFTNLLFPERIFTLRVELERKLGKIQFSMTQGERRLSCGTLILMDSLESDHEGE